MIEVELLGVQSHRDGHLLLLREMSGDRRIMTVVIDTPEARSIYLAMEGIEVPRPQSHDLMRTLIAELGGEVTQICITDLRDRTFHATMQLEQGSTTYTITARPSDAIAIAARTDAPIFVSEHVMDEAGQVIKIGDVTDAGEGDPDVNPDELIDEFKSFLADVKAEDFGASGEADPNEPEPDKPEPDKPEPEPDKPSPDKPEPDEEGDEDEGDDEDDEPDDEGDDESPQDDDPKAPVS